MWQATISANYNLKNKIVVTADLFVFGNTDGFEMVKFEGLIKKEIHLIAYNNVKLLKKELDPNLIINIIKGFNIKGNLEPFEVRINA